MRAVMAEPHSRYQTEIYLSGLAGKTPTYPIAWDDLERAASEILGPDQWGYIEGGAGTGQTMRANREAFHRWRIVPRMLRDVTERDLSTDLLGTSMPAPVLLAPIGVQSLAHADGELPAARAAGALGVPFIASTSSTRSLKAIAEANGDGPRWFQLYWPRDAELTKSFVSRAKDAGYTAIVVTLDTFILSWRPMELRNAFSPFLRGEGCANYFEDPVFRSRLTTMPEDDPGEAIGNWIGQFIDPSKTWDDLAGLRAMTDLPILLKGILDPRDARRAVEAGMDGIVVSNHGGRQVDGAIATLDALPSIVEEVGGRIPILMDSGIRCGADAFKAIALGARAVLLGRPYVWGLALDGEAGVTHVIRSFLAELDLTLALSGYTSLADIGPDSLEAAPL